MKPQWAASWLLLLLVGLLGLAGCDDDRCIDCGDPGIQPASVLLFLPDDTLRYLADDTTCMDGWAVVVDNSGRVLPGVVVSVVLDIESPGALEFLDPARGDTTDANGRVYFRYCTPAQSGVANIHAAVGDLVDEWDVAVLPAHSRPPVRLYVGISYPQPDTSAGLHDSLFICVVITDSLNQGIEGLLLPIQADGGRISPIETTDATGKACFWWYLTDLSPGHHCLYFHIADAFDSLCVEVLSRHYVQIVMAADTLAFESGDDSLVVGGSVLVTDGNGNALPGTQVDFWLDPAMGYLIFPTALRDTSDAAGRISFRWTTFQAGQTWIHARACESEDSARLYVLSQPALEPAQSLHIYMVPSTLFVGDSSYFCAVVLDDSARGLEGYSVFVTMGGGHMDPLPLTNSGGFACAWWYPDAPGNFFLTARTFGAADTILVTVRP